MQTIGVISFAQADAPITELTTKFGGQPVWLEAPEWPLNKNTKEPLAFIGQVMLDEKIYGPSKAKVAYLFINPEEDTENYAPEDGENAVIMQPGNNTFYECVAQATGPAMQHDTRAGFDTEGLCEFAAQVTLQQDAPVAEDKYKRIRLDLENPPSSVIQQENVHAVLGGQPAWLQAPDFPFEEARLIIQMEDDVPLKLDFGRGDLYAFMNQDGSQAKCLWQC